MMVKRSAVIVSLCILLAYQCHCDEVHRSKADSHDPTIVTQFRQITLNDNMSPKCQRDYLDKISKEIPSYQQGNIADIVLSYFKDKADNNQTCYENVISYINTAFKQDLSGEAKRFLGIFQDTLQSLRRSQETHCQTTCTKSLPPTCTTTCNETYIKLAKWYYNETTLVESSVLQPLDDNVGNVYLVRDYCMSRLGHAFKVLATTQRSDSAYDEYQVKIRADTKMCVQAGGRALENAIQNLRCDIDQAALYRAMVCRDMKPWLDAIATLVSTNPGSNLTETSSGLSLKWTNGSRIMLRQTTEKGKWWHCGDTCQLTNCPGNGPRYNESSDTSFLTRCPGVAMYVEKIADDGKGQQWILVHDQVKLLTDDRRRITWEYAVPSLPNEKGNGSCSTTDLLFVRVRDETPSPQHSVFTMEAWDWAGRRRLPGEKIADRDWVVFMYSDQVPDYNEKWFGKGLPYIEGFIFILP